jgi:hypothetical protein
VVITGTEVIIFKSKSSGRIGNGVEILVSMKWQMTMTMRIASTLHIFVFVLGSFNDDLVVRLVNKELKIMLEKAVVI